MASIRIQAVKKFGFIRQIAEAAKVVSKPLAQTLIASQAAVNSPTFSKGRIVISQSGSGQSGSFLIPTNGVEWTQYNIFGLLEEFLQITEQLVAGGMTDDGDPANTDLLRAAIVDAYNSGNVPEYGVREQMGDFSMLNT